MRIPGNLSSYCIKALSQSMDNRTMTALARRLLPGYDLHERTGIPSSVAIPNRNAATQLVEDVINSQMFLDFVVLLIDASEKGKGIAGRKMAIPYLRQILNGVYQMGFIYDPGSSMFVENPAERKTRNWGTLKIGQEYTISFLRLDIAGNSGLVRNNDEKTIEHAYGCLREITVKAVERRNGRIWGWDGDGGLAAFCFTNMNQFSVHAALDILHELFIYNNTYGATESPLDIRLAVHCGPFCYTSNNEEMLSSDTVKTVIAIEHKFAETNSLCISNPVMTMMDPLTAGMFTACRHSSGASFFKYKLKTGCEK